MESNIYNLTELFRILGNPTRIRILLILAEHETCVSELTDKLGYTQSAISHQLSILKSNKLVKQHRTGKMIFYTLTNEYVRQIIENCAFYSTLI